MVVGRGEGVGVVEGVGGTEADVGEAVTRVDVGVQAFSSRVAYNTHAATRDFFSLCGWLLQPPLMLGSTVYPPETRLV
jgi:hypothetical protein